MFRHYYSSLALVVYLVIALFGTCLLEGCQATAAKEKTSSMITACPCHNSSDSFVKDDNWSGRTAMNICLVHGDPDALLLNVHDIAISWNGSSDLFVVEQEPQVSCQANHCTVYAVVIVSETMQVERKDGFDELSMSGTAYVQETVSNGTLTMTQEMPFTVTSSLTTTDNDTCPDNSDDETPVRDAYVAKGIGLVIFVMVMIVVACCCCGNQHYRRRTRTNPSDIPV